MNSPFRGGMQVHAVPESERAYDQFGRQLPWAYEYADSESNQRRAPEEKGPFGKATRRRGLSRSKTTTPARKEDLAKLENQKFQDDLFGNIKAQDREHARSRKPAVTPGTTVEATTAPVPTTIGGEPTEVILYGFGADVQWAAIEFFERVSYGSIYEDYDRHPPNSKYNNSLSASRAYMQRSMSQAALRKSRNYKGGEHWIKVTFDSSEAADRACASSPHIICGYRVFAELYRGTGPTEDIAIPASMNGLPSSFSPNARSSTTLRAHTSETASSATLTQPEMTEIRDPFALPRSISAPGGFGANFPSAPADSQSLLSSDSTVTPTATGREQLQANRPLRIRGAKRAVLLPAEQALLPVQPKWQQSFANLPLISLFVGSGKDVLGTEVPRREDGGFDWDHAGLYWRFWAWIDWVFGSDFLGLKED